MGDVRTIRYVIVLIHFLNFPAGLVTGSGGDIPSTWVAGARLHYGFIIPHYKELKSISQTHPWGIELDVGKMLLSDKSWSNCNCYGRVGISANYFNYQNPDVLGSSYSLVLFGEPYLGFTKRIHVSVRGGTGITYLSKVYDAETNPENVFYSSPVSFMLLMQLTLNYRINEHYRIRLTANYNHVSNAGSSMPNKGMNFPTLSAGMEYFINPQPMIKKPKAKGLMEDDPFYYARLFSSIRTVEAGDSLPEVKKLMIGLEAGGFKGLTSINAIGLGLEFSYDGSYDEMSERMNENYSPFIISLAAGHAFVFGKFSFTQQFAWYAYRPFPANDKEFFQRYGIYYTIGKYVNFGASLKAHGHVAEHMDIRLGLIF